MNDTFDEAMKKIEELNKILTREFFDSLSDERFAALARALQDLTDFVTD